MQVEDFLKVFGSWVVEIKKAGKTKEFKVSELYEMFNNKESVVECDDPGEYKLW